MIVNDIINIIIDIPPNFNVIPQGDQKIKEFEMKTFKISYEIDITEEELREYMGDNTTSIDELLDTYLWQEMNIEGDDWDVKESNL